MGSLMLQQPMFARPQPPKNSLHDIVDFFSRFEPYFQHTPLRIHSDYLIETPVGCFRMAYSRQHQCTMLFYARNAGDLAVSDNDGPMEFVHKDRIYLVGSHKIHKTPKEKDGKLPFDNAWVISLIHDVIYSLPRTLLREANLFRLQENLFSEYVTYQPLEAGINGAVRINIFTNARKTYDLAAIEAESPDGT